MPVAEPFARAPLQRVKELTESYSSEFQLSDESQRIQQEAEKIELDAFRLYLGDLGLTKEEISGKKILDVGAGPRLFAGYCVRSGLNKEVYSLDLQGSHFEPARYQRLKSAQDLYVKISEEEDEDEIFSPDPERVINLLWDEKTRATVNSHSVVANWEAIPLDTSSVDLIVMYYAIPSTRKEASRLLTELTRVVKVGGEIRIYPFDQIQGDFEGVQNQGLTRYLSEVEDRAVYITQKLNAMIESGKFNVRLEAVEEGKLSEDGTLKEISSRIVIQRLS